MTLSRRHCLIGLSGLAVAGLPRAAGAADAPPPEPQFLRLIAGASGSALFGFAGALATALTSPPGARACDHGGSCGVPGLIAVAQALPAGEDDPAAALGTIARGEADAAIVPAAIAAAFDGAGPRAPRLVGTILINAVHVLVRADDPAQSLEDLAERRIILELAGGVHPAIRAVLNRAGLPKGLRAGLYQTPAALEMLASGKADAVFLMGPPPIAAVAALAQVAKMRLLPVPAFAEDAGEAFGVAGLVPSLIPAEAYAGGVATPTIGLAIQFIVAAGLGPDLVCDLAKALWSPGTLKALRAGSALGIGVDPAQALRSVTVPLHPGAARYYRDANLLPVGVPVGN